MLDFSSPAKAAMRASARTKDVIESPPDEYSKKIISLEVLRISICDRGCFRVVSTVDSPESYLQVHVRNWLKSRTCETQSGETRHSNGGGSVVGWGYMA